MPSRRPEVKIKRSNLTVIEHKLLADIRDRLDILIKIGNQIVPEPVTIEDIKEF